MRGPGYPSPSPFLCPCLSFQKIKHSSSNQSRSGSARGPSRVTFAEEEDEDDGAHERSNGASSPPVTLQEVLFGVWSSIACLAPFFLVPFAFSHISSCLLSVRLCVVSALLTFLVGFVASLCLYSLCVFSHERQMGSLLKFLVGLVALFFVLPHELQMMQRG